MIVSSLVICSQHGLNVQLDAPNPPQVSKAGTGPGAGPLITTPDKIQKQGVVPDEGILCRSRAGATYCSPAYRTRRWRRSSRAVTSLPDFSTSDGAVPAWLASLAYEVVLVTPRSNITSFRRSSRTLIHTSPRVLTRGSPWSVTTMA